jgi:hypothetical protein
MISKGTFLVYAWEWVRPPHQSKSVDHLKSTNWSWIHRRLYCGMHYSLVLLRLGNGCQLSYVQYVLMRTQLQFGRIHLLIRNIQGQEERTTTFY